MRLCATAWIAALVLACGGQSTAPDASVADSGVEEDAAATLDAGPVVDPPVPPALPEPPRMTPCRSGWHEVGTGDEISCDPWPAGGRPACAHGDVIFPGEEACAGIGGPCPAGGGTWHDGLAGDGTVLFVRAPDGDPVLGGAGTRESPFETIAEALAAAAPGATVALSAGTFHEVVPLASAVTLQGACVARTVLDAPLPAGGGTLQISGPGVVVRDLEVRGEGIWVRTGGAVQLEGVVVARATPFGIVVDGGAVNATRLVIRDCWGDLGIGLHVQGGTFDAHQLVSERNRTMGLSVIGIGRMTIDDVAVRDTVEATDGMLGVGLAVGQGGLAELEGAVFESNHTSGAYVLHRGSTLRLTDGLIRDTTAQRLDGDGGYGLSVNENARVELERVVLEGNQTGGIGMIEGSFASLRDVVVRDTLPRGDGIGGFGIALTTFSDLDLERVLIARSLGTGITVGNVGTTARFTDLIVRDTGVQPFDEDGGYGLSFGEPVAVVLTRALLERSTTAGVYGFGGATLEATDVTIRDTASHPSGLFGRALDLQEATCDLERGVFEGNREASVLAGGEGTVVTLRDVVVDGTRPRACVDDPDGCPTAGAGAGIVSLLSASVDVTRFVVRGNASCGVQVARDGAMALHDGEVSDNPIGANVQVEGFDFGLLQDRVLFHDNGRNLDSSVLAVPDQSF